MANDPNSPNIQDIINQAAAGANMSPAAPQSLVQPPMADPSAPQPPTLLNNPTPAPAPGVASQTDPNTADLESRIATPGSLALGANADKANEQKEQQANPSMMQKIGRIAATVAGGPQLAKPGSTPEQKAAGIMGILGKVGQVGVMATGSPQQREQAIQQQGQQNQLMQMKNEAMYREGMLGNTANKNAETVLKDRAAEDAKLQESTRKYELQGMMPEPGGDPRNPHFIDMPPEVAMNNAVMGQNLAVKQAATDAARANALYKQAQTDALQNPGGLTQQNKVEDLRIKALNAGRTYAKSMFDMRAKNQEDLLNYGRGVPGGVPGDQQPAQRPNGGRPSGPTEENPQGLNLDNAPDGFLVNPATGQPIPTKMLSAMKPTMDEQKRADFAKSALHSVDNIEQLVQRANAMVGPFQGPIGDLMAKAGLGDQYNQEIRNYAGYAQSAATAAHTGRFSVPILEKMDKMFSTNMNADQMAGALHSTRDVMNTYANAGWKPTVAEYNAWLSGSGTKPSGEKATPTSPGQPKAGASQTAGAYKPVAGDRPIMKAGQIVGYMGADGTRH